MANLETQLLLVRDGRIDFGAFVAHTRSEFAGMAGYLARRWSPPSCTTLDDIEQELYLGAWRFVWEWNPKRGVSIARYVVFNAVGEAKRALHKARGAKLSGSPDRNPSRFAIPVSHLFVVHDDAEVEHLLNINSSSEPQQEELLIAAEEKRAATIEAFKGCTTTPQRMAVLAISEAGSVEGGAQILYDDVDARIALRLDSEAHARRWVYREASNALGITPG